ncbi:MAG TPA: elongation factor P [Verrucomicrobiae bacterium]|nr:elongation factor P [Verrucomicrobiae bacterium]
MQSVLTSEFKRGMVLLLDGAPQMLEEFHVSGTAQTRHKLHARLRHLKTGRIADHTFSEGERVPVADVSHRRVQFSYHDGKDYVFSDVESFEEMSLSAEQIGDRRGFIKENVEYRALLLDGRLLNIVLPPNVTLEVVATDPPVRGGVDTTWKPARLDTGLEIMVPLFIAPGEKIHVDTATRKYAGRENEGKK